jgi:hypothetical protein
MTKLVISLTTIPPRFNYVRECISSLLKQTAKIESINLYIPYQYRRFDYSPSSLPKPEEGVNIRFADEDLGPATKILPACREYRGQDVRILFCDDDKVYDQNWAQRFIEAAKKYPNYVICEEGGQLSSKHYANDDWISSRQPQAIFRRKDLGYRLRRAISLGRWKPSKTISSGYVDVLEGWGGVLVKPDFFDDSAWHIPDVLWTVDDIWLSGCLEKRGIPIWLNAQDKVRSKGNSNEVKQASLRKLVYQGHDRIAANRSCIRHFRQNDNIWGGVQMEKTEY